MIEVATIIHGGCWYEFECSGKAGIRYPNNGGRFNEEFVCTILLDSRFHRFHRFNGLTHSSSSINVRIATIPRWSLVQK